MRPTARPLVQPNARVSSSSSELNISADLGRRLPERAFGLTSLYLCTTHGFRCGTLRDLAVACLSYAALHSGAKPKHRHAEAEPRRRSYKRFGFRAHRHQRTDLERHTRHRQRGVGERPSRRHDFRRLAATRKPGRSIEDARCSSPSPKESRCGRRACQRRRDRRAPRRFRQASRRKRDAAAARVGVAPARCKIETFTTAPGRPRGRYEREQRYRAAASELQRCGDFFVVLLRG